MKVIIAPDSFKGSLSSIEISKIISDEFSNAFNDIEIINMPMSDGGEGSLEIIMNILGGDIYYEDVIGPDGNIISAAYGIDKNNVAIIELAKASGMYRQSNLNPMTSNTYGFGQLIKAALHKGVQDFILCLGGSASTDMGIGMANALGIDFYDKDNNLINPCGQTLKDINRIDYSNKDPLLDDARFKVYCDVSNVLYGQNGAAYVYAKQKGASDEEIKLLDEGLRQLSYLIDIKLGYSRAGDLFTGAAGGTGYGCMHFLNAQLLSGIKAILNLYNYEEIVKDADIIITGEGKLDKQSFNGKVISGLMLAPDNIPIISICGSLDISEDLPKEFLDDNNIKAYQLINYGDLDDCLDHPEKYIRLICKDIIEDLKKE